MTLQSRPLDIARRFLSAVILPFVVLHYIALGIWEDDRGIGPYVCDIDICTRVEPSFLDSILLGRLAFYAKADGSDWLSYHVAALVVVFLVLLVIAVLIAIGFHVITGKNLLSVLLVNLMTKERMRKQSASWTNRHPCTVSRRIGRMPGRDSRS